MYHICINLFNALRQMWVLKEENPQTLIVLQRAKSLGSRRFMATFFSAPYTLKLLAFMNCPIPASPPLRPPLLAWFSPEMNHYRIRNSCSSQIGAGIHPQIIHTHTHTIYIYLHYYIVLQSEVDQWKEYCYILQQNHDDCCCEQIQCHSLYIDKNIWITN